tara:strand:- start:88 stop:531 length:444 start_codon:yes stop_codon:yes gene_type:complete
MNKINESWMKLALVEARKALRDNEVPIGAVIVKDNKIISKAYNQVELLKDSTAHAEMIAITSASNSLNNWRLSECDLYVTLEPCAMCSGAIIKSRIRNIFFGAYNNSDGCVSSLYNLCSDPRFNHQSGVKGGILEQECSYLLTSFFK